MTDLTPTNMSRIRDVEHYHWNSEINGGWHEYRLEVYSAGKDGKCLLSVQFKPHQYDWPRVYFTYSRNREHFTLLPSITTLTELASLYALLTGKPEDYGRVLSGFNWIPCVTNNNCGHCGKWLGHENYDGICLECEEKFCDGCGMEKAKDGHCPICQPTDGEKLLHAYYLENDMRGRRVDALDAQATEE